jgi:hypothetical protein
MKHIQIFRRGEEGVLSRISWYDRTLAHCFFGLLEKLKPISRAIFEMELSTKHHLVYLISLIHHILICLKVIIFFKWLE